MSTSELSHFDELVSHYLDDDLAPAQAAELLALLSEPPLAARFLEMARLNSEISGLLAAPVPDVAMVELVRIDLNKISAGELAVDDARLRIMHKQEAPAPASRRGSAPHMLFLQRKPARQVLAWAAVFLVFGGLAAFFLVNRTQLAAAPAVVSVQGEVRLVGSAGERELTPAESWHRDEKLETVGPESTVTLRFGDGSQVALAGNTLAVHESGKAGRRVRLEHGVVQAILKKQPAGRPFIFATPEAEAVVVGTTLRLAADPHAARLEVTEGEVRFSRRHDRTVVTVKAGQYAVIAPNVPLEARPLHAGPHQ